MILNEYDFIHKYYPYEEISDDDMSEKEDLQLLKLKQKRIR